LNIFSGVGGLDTRKIFKKNFQEIFLGAHPLGKRNLQPSEKNFPDPCLTLWKKIFQTLKNKNF
jgi:hypothetical protein